MAAKPKHYNRNFACNALANCRALGPNDRFRPARHVLMLAWAIQRQSPQQPFVHDVPIVVL